MFVFMAVLWWLSFVHSVLDFARIGFVQGDRFIQMKTILSICKLRFFLAYPDGMLCSCVGGFGSVFWVLAQQCALEPIATVQRVFSFFYRPVTDDGVDASLATICFAKV